MLWPSPSSIETWGLPSKSRCRACARASATVTRPTSIPTGAGLPFASNLPNETKYSMPHLFRNCARTLLDAAWPLKGVVGKTCGDKPIHEAGAANSAANETAQGGFRRIIELGGTFQKARFAWKRSTAAQQCSHFECGAFNHSATCPTGRRRVGAPYSTAAERVEKPNLRCKKAKKRRNGIGEREPRSTPGKHESALENSMLKRGQPKKLSKSPLSVVSAALTARVHPLPYPGEPPWPPLHARTSISTSTPNAAVAGSQLTERSGTAVEDGRITRGMSSAANATTGQPLGNRHSCVPTFARRKSIRARSCTRGRRQPMAIAPQTIFPSLRQTG